MTKVTPALSPPCGRMRPMFKNVKQRDKSKPFRQRWRESGYDHRFIDEGYVREVHGTVFIDPQLLNGVPHADLAWNVVTGEAKEYVGVMEELLPDEYWYAMNKVLKDFDKARIHQTCTWCERDFHTPRAMKDHRCKSKNVTTKMRDRKLGLSEEARKRVANITASKQTKEVTVSDDTPTTPPPPLPEGEVEWVLHAVQRQAAGTTPEPGTAKVDAAGKTKVRRGSAEKVFGAILEHGGAAVTVDQLVNETGLTRQQVHNGCHYLVSKGIVIRLMSGIYQIHPDAVKLSERVNVDVRHHDVTIPVAGSPSAVPEAAQTAPNGATGTSVPPAAARPAERPTAPNGDDEDSLIESVLDLLMPEGFKARHLGAINRWQEATRELLRSVDN